MTIFEVKVKELMMIKIRYKKIMTFIVVMALIFSIESVNNSFRSKAEENYGVSNPEIDSRGITTWDCIYFGHYWQNDTNGDEIANKKDDKEVIKWRVLNVNGNDAMLVSDKNIDCKKYNELYTNITWKECTLRSWLNGYDASYNSYGADFKNDNFIDEAFTPNEKKAILSTNVINDNSEYNDIYSGPNTNDKIYLLSISDIYNKEYGFSNDNRLTMAKNTPFAEMNGAYTNATVDSNYYKNGYWWLRSLGKIANTASYVNYDGWNVSCCNVDFIDVAVRPVVHIDLSQKGIWAYAGKLKSDGQTTEILPDTTNTPETPAIPSTKPSDGSTVVPTISPTGQVVPKVKSVPKLNGNTSYKKYMGNGSFKLNVTSPSSGKRTYKSSNNKVVKVTSSGTVSVIGCGTATVTVHLDETVSYYEASKKIQISVYPAKVSAFKAKNKKGTLVCTWKKQNVKNIKCQIQASYTSNFKKSYSLKAKPALNKGKVNANGLSTKKNYYVRIRAFIKIAGREYDGQWSKKVKVKVK